MLVIPAIDLRAGKCVRMRQGDPSTTASYDDDPVERPRVDLVLGGEPGRGAVPYGLAGAACRPSRSPDRHVRDSGSMN